MTIVWGVALYILETWTFRKYETDRLEAFVDIVQYGKYQLEGSQNQRICARPSKREKKAFE